MAKLVANRRDPDQTPRSAASDLGLHCSQVTLLRVTRLQWVNCSHMPRRYSSYRAAHFVPMVYSSLGIHKQTRGQSSLLK